MFVTERPYLILENRMQGITDSPLTSKGIEQILQTTEALRNQSFNSAYTSPLPRTIQTAKLILEPHHMHAKSLTHYVNLVMDHGMEILKMKVTQNINIVFQ